MIAALLLAFIPADSVLTDYVDIVEFNTSYTPGNPPNANLCQLIFWRWNDDCREHHVVAWRSRTYTVSGRILTPDWPLARRVGGRWYVDWHEHGILRRVICHEIRSSVTPYDPEIERRHFRPIESRPKLSPIPTR